MKEITKKIGNAEVTYLLPNVDPEPRPPELSQTEKDLLAIMEGVAATYERQEKTGLDIMEGIAGLYEATLSGGKV